ncbi:hypothetical protein BU16DRAFT_557983 [Lophium mytilinum]|uniref:Uncharacterized protein n=1 Tax=Lophium mytilinum TaxID=390894 RepID=A0A6A6R4M0_9PEZI|nr:hypothetical protein BU16DRAFT_557983 [Lophium mytilinum]
MSLPTLFPRPHFRPPSTALHLKPTSLPSFQAPLSDLFTGDWFILRSSNPFWKDKRNVRLHYNPAPSGSHIEDTACYQTMISDTVKIVVGKDTPVDGETGTYTWQGKGLLRVARGRWEILSFTARDGGDWMLVFAHKTLFSASAINLLCRRKEGLSKEDLGEVEEWLNGVEDEKFQQAARGVFDIKQE